MIFGCLEFILNTRIRAVHTPSTCDATQYRDAGAWAPHTQTHMCAACMYASKTLTQLSSSKPDRDSQHEPSNIMRPQ